MRLLLLLCLTPLVLASAAMAQDTTVQLRPLVDFVLPIILTVVGGLVSIATAVLVPILVQKFRLQNEAYVRDAIQTSLTNTASGLIRDLGARAADLQIDLRNPKIREVVQRAIDGAQDSMAKTGWTQEVIAGRVLEKVTEQLTAAGIVVPPNGAPR